MSEVKERLAGNQKLEQAEMVVREILNEVGIALLSRFSEEITHKTKTPNCPKCQQPMSPKEWVVSKVHTTFGEMEEHGIDYRCIRCKQYKRIHGDERPERARLSPLFSSILVLFGATWPQQVALFCTLVTFGQKVSKRTVHNLLQKEAAPSQIIPLIAPENTRVCTDGVLVNGLEKGRKIEAKVVSVFSETQEVGQKGKQQVKDVSFLASGNQPWNELSGPLIQTLQERGVTDFSSIVCVGDGAKGIWEMLKYGAPKSIQMLDEYHTKKKVTTRCKEHFEKKLSSEISSQVNEELDIGDVDEAIRTLLTAWAVYPAQEKTNNKSDSIDKLVGYLRRHQTKIEARVKAKKEGKTKGTGLQEKANDVVCARRCKEGEMHWSRDGLDRILQHRCSILHQANLALAA